MTAMHLPEILSPARDMEALTFAVRFGADAVYVGADRFGMRSAAAYFDEIRLPQAVEYAHAHNVKLYLTCNILPHNDALHELPDFVRFVSSAGVDAMIVSDLGVLDIVKQTAPEMELHVSTQAGITNYAAANACYRLGAKRIIPARELSLREIREIRAHTPPELAIECFVHGAMCVSFSGRCLLSGYMTGRDSNRGDCAQPCRWKYRLVEENRPGQYFPIDEEDGGTYILNSKDLCMLPYVAQLIEAGVDSFKIEGRAKSSYYSSVITNAYRAAVDGYRDSPSSDYVPAQWILDESKKVSYRDYCTGFYFEPSKQESNIFYDGNYRRPCEFCAVAISWEDGVLTAEQRNKFRAGETLEVLEPQRPPFQVTAKDLVDEEGTPIPSAPHPQMRLRFKTDIPIRPGALLRRIPAQETII